jgi:DNA polymerase-3 subunit chi
MARLSGSVSEIWSSPVPLSCVSCPRRSRRPHSSRQSVWTYDDASFLPHGAAGDGDPMTQPIFLTSELENPNAATMLVRLSGAEAGEADDAFDVVVLMFDGRDEAALAQARGEWRRLKDQGRTISYWRESDEGGWERAR